MKLKRIPLLLSLLFLHGHKSLLASSLLAFCVSRNLFLSLSIFEFFLVEMSRIQFPKPKLVRSLYVDTGHDHSITVYNNNADSLAVACDSDDEDHYSVCANTENDAPPSKMIKTQSEQNNQTLSVNNNKKKKKKKNKDNSNDTNSHDSLEGYISEDTDDEDYVDCLSESDSEDLMSTFDEDQEEEEEEEE